MAKRETLGQSLAAGFGHVRQSNLLFVMMALAASASFLAFPLTTYLPVIAGDVFRTGAKGYSQLLTSFGVGAILGALVTAHRGKAKGRGRTLLASLAVYGLASADRRPVAGGRGWPWRSCSWRASAWSRRSRS